jgi:hypothetical protein
MMVSYSPTPGAELAPMGNGVLSNRVGCPCHAGLYFEAYSYDPGDLGADHQLRGVGADFWAARRPVAQHEEHVRTLWYENEDALVAEMEGSGFDQRDNYLFRWRGQIEIAAAGDYSPGRVSVVQCPSPLTVLKDSYDHACY